MKYILLLAIFTSCLSQKAEDINGMIVIEPNTKKQYMIQACMEYGGFRIYELTKTVIGTDTLSTFKEIQK